MFILIPKTFNALYRTNVENNRGLGVFRSSFEIFTTYFGLRQDKANDYIDCHRLNRLPPEFIMKVIKFCEEVGFEKRDMLHNPMLLRTHSSTLDQNYCVMKEGGFNQITAGILAKFRTHYRKKVGTLKAQGLIKPDTHVSQSFIQYLTPCPENFSVTNCPDSLAWCDVHLNVLIQYLKWRLQASDDDIAKLITVHSNIRRKSFKYLCENIEIATNLGLEPKKILKYGYVLQAHPKNTKEVFEKFPTIGGVCMKKAMRMYPKLLNTSVSNFEKIYSILEDHNIPDEAIGKRLNVFQLSPDTVEFRLKELERDGDLKVHLHNPNVLKLVVHHNRAKSRLLYLKQLQLKCTSVTVLGDDDAKFDGHIKGGKDSNTAKDTYAFLKGIFKKNVEDIEVILRKHPYYLKVPLKSMEKTYKYLKEEKITNSAIFSVLYILLYPKEKVKNAIKQVREFEKHRRRRLDQTKRLNLVLYFIEKEHHFTGDGIWEKIEPIEETAQAP